MEESHVFASTGMIRLVVFTYRMGVKWYVIMVLICVSLMTNDVEHFSLSLLAIHISSLVNYLFSAFTILSYHY